MLLNKSKSEDRALPEWLDFLVGPLYLDFVAPYPLEEALDLLQAQERHGFFRYRKVWVELTPVDADTFAFYVKKYGNKYATTEAHGYLKRWDRKTTHVTGRVNVVAYQYLVYLFFVLFGAVFIYVGLEIMWWFPLLFMGIMAMSWAMMRHNRYDVAGLIEQTLDADLGDDDNPIKWNA